MLPVVEIFNSIQGEGKHTGYPSIFVRVSGCNLRCVFKDSRCDTPYTSFEPEKKLYETMDDLIKAFTDMKDQFPKTKHIVITGGEPLLYKKDLELFLTRITGIYGIDEFTVTIETNGTMPILNPLDPKCRVDLYSISPKLSTSVDKDCKFLTKEQAENHNKNRLNYKNLYDMVMYSRDYQLKFVYSGEECIQEIKNIFGKMAEFVNKGDDFTYNNWMRRHPNKHTMLMPEGITNEQIIKTGQDAVEKCIENGWVFADRVHIHIYGDKRGV